MRLKAIKNIDGIIEIVTGTRVGGSSSIIEIGGNDSPIIRNPLNGEMYIPGSSLKGKMRMMMEWLEDKIETTQGKEGEPHSCNDENCPICKVFGKSADNSKKEKKEKKVKIGPTRIIVRDAYLTDKSRKMLEELKDETGLDTEWKYENTINRLDSSANPRNSERIPAGVQFNFSISYKVIDLGDDGKEDEENFEKIVLKGLKALLLEGIGGGVSRGNGQIKFVDLKIDGESKIKDKSVVEIVEKMEI